MIGSRSGCAVNDKRRLASLLLHALHIVGKILAAVKRMGRHNVIKNTQSPPQPLQAVIDNTPRGFDDASRGFAKEDAPSAPAPFWTATILPWRTEKSA